MLGKQTFIFIFGRISENYSFSYNIVKFQPRLVEDIKPVTGELPVQFTVEDLRNLNLNADNSMYLLINVINKKNIYKY